MDLNPTGRFSSRVQDYIRYRPSYPPAVIALLERECGLRPESKVADIGSGTGFLSQLFLQLGCEVVGVEPNSEMRLAGERLLSGERRFRSADGRAESTGLPTRSMDFVTAGQAFHWFDTAAARKEFDRILRPGGWIVLVWNERLVEGRFLEEYEDLLARYAPEYSQVDHRRMDAAVMDGFYGPGQWNLATFPNAQLLNFEGVMGRLDSSSYAPAPDSEAHTRMTEALAQVFEECVDNGRVAFRYETKVYYGH